MSQKLGIGGLKKTFQMSILPLFIILFMSQVKTFKFFWYQICLLAKYHQNLTMGDICKYIFLYSSQLILSLFLPKGHLSAHEPSDIKKGVLSGHSEQTVAFKQALQSRGQLLHIPSSGY